MVLNDVFDLQQDRAERSARPLAAGHISLGHARLAGWGLLLWGVLLGALSGYLPAGDYPVTWFPAVISLLLAIAIVAYDGPLKQTPLAPAAMGACRALSFLLGASPCLSFVDGEPLVPPYLLAIALGFGTYVMGVTTMGRREAVGGASPNLPIGLVVIILGAVVLALGPQFAPGPRAWQVSATDVFPMMIAIIVFPVVVRGYRAVREPTPARIQMTIRVGVLTIIPLAAAFAVLGAGPIWGLLVFAFVIPSLLLAARLRVT